MTNNKIVVWMQSSLDGFTAGPNGESGGSRTVAALAQADLIDEYQIFVHPVVLGGGTPFFPPLAGRQAMTLVESRTFDGRVAGLRYARARETS